MATASVTYVFANGTNADGTQVNANFTSVLNFLNTEVVQRDASIAFTAVPTLPAIDPTLDNHAVRKRYVDLLMPAGIITPYAGTSIPTGWILCDGSAVSRTNPTYTRLFAAIGTAYGAGDGSTTFNLPNLKGRIPVGLDAAQVEFDTMGEAGGAKTHTLSIAEFPSHTHIQDSHNHTQNSHTHLQDAHTHTQNAHTHIQNAHTHTQDAHTHTQNSHTHLQDAHGHGQNAHNHLIYMSTSEAGSHRHEFTDAGTNAVARTTTTGTANTSSTTQVTDFTEYAGSHTHDVIGWTGDTTATVVANTATNQSTTAVNLDATAVNQSTTAVNLDATAVNQSNTAVNQPATATNIAATATNQNTGGSGAHNNLQPYVVVNYLIKL